MGIFIRLLQLLAKPVLQKVLRASAGGGLVYTFSVYVAVGAATGGRRSLFAAITPYSINSTQEASLVVNSVVNDGALLAELAAEGVYEAMGYASPEDLMEAISVIDPVIELPQALTDPGIGGGTSGVGNSGEGGSGGVPESSASSAVIASPSSLSTTYWGGSVGGGSGGTDSGGVLESGAGSAGTASAPPPSPTASPTIILAGVLGGLLICAALGMLYFYHSRLWLWRTEPPQPQLPAEM